MATISVKSAPGLSLGILGSDIITSFSTWWLQLFQRHKKFFHSRICQIKKIYCDTTKQVNLLNYFLNIRVLLGWLSTFAVWRGVKIEPSLVVYIFIWVLLRSRPPTTGGRHQDATASISPRHLGTTACELTNSFSLIAEHYEWFCGPFPMTPVCGTWQPRKHGGHMNSAQY